MLYDAGMRGLRKTSSDRDLIRACRTGDPRSWRLVVDKYERLVYSIPLNYRLSRADAADVAQLTFTILIQSLDSLSDDSNLGGWLATVARRHTWRLLERKRREETGKEEDLAGSAALVGKPGADSVEHWELTQWLHEGLSLINEPCRNLLNALYFDEEQPSYADISDRLDIPVGSIGPTRARCLQRLRKAMDVN